MVLDAKLLEMRIAIQMCDYVPKTVYQFENQSIQDSGKKHCFRECFEGL